MRRVLAVIVASLVCASVWASRGRPVSDLRFDGSVNLGAGFVASDGKDFLFLSSTGSNPYVYLQRVVGGTQVGPSLGIGAGTAAGIAWTGSEYLISWSAVEGMWTARASRLGALIEGSKRLVVSRAGSFASNSQSALATGRIDASTLLAQPLDLSGLPSGPAVTLSIPLGENVAVGPSASGYAIVTTGWTQTLLRRVRSDGTPMSASPVSLEGPYGSTSTAYHSDHSVVASDGTDTLVLFAGEKYQADTELKTVIIGPDGAVKRAARTAFTIPGAGGRSLQPAAVVWTGSEYVVALAVSKDPTGNFTTVDAGLLRISRSGDVIGDVGYTTSGERRKVPIGLGWNGSQLLVPWYDATNQGGVGSYCAAVPIATMIPSAAAPLGRILNAQSGLTIAAGNGQYLAAWFESGASTTVRASRIDGSGNFLDGEGIVLATLPPPLSRYATPGLAVDSDGTNWLVVWGDGTVRGRRLSRTGSLLDAQPFIITAGTDVAVQWNGSNYAVVAGGGSLNTAAVSAQGVVSSSRTLMPSNFQIQPSGSSWYLSYTSPSLIAVGGETLAVYLNVFTTCYIGTPGGCGTESTVVGWRLDSSANPVGAAFTLAQNVWSTPKLASDGTHHLLAWSAYDAAVGTGSVFGTVFSVEGPQPLGTPFRIASKASVRDVAFDGSDFLVGVQDATVGVARVASTGAVRGVTTLLPLDDGESAANPTFAVGRGMPALVGYLDLHPAYDGRSRGTLLFATEFEPAVAAVPSPPSFGAALRIDQNTVDVRWQPSFGALGTAVELQLEDGAYRTIGVAAGAASSARFSLAGLQGSAIRLRAWNAAGLSEGSKAVPIALPRQRSARAH